MNIIFGSRLKKLRMTKALTQQDLAVCLNISKSNISKYENGTIEPSFEILIKISDYFEVSIDYLLGKTDIENIYKNTSTYKFVDMADINDVIAPHHDGDEFTIEERQQIRSLLKMLENKKNGS